jgi:hypothetical protein
MLRPTHSQGVCRLRYHEELHDMYKDIPFSTYIWIKRLIWAGQFIGTEDYRIPKKILVGSFRGIRPVGRPSSRWEENVQKEAVSLFHIQNWKPVAQIRQNWRKKTGEVVTQIRADVPHERERYYQKSGIDVGTWLDKLNVSDLIR